MKLTRASGILAHPTSFPSPFGIGDLGWGAFRFVDFLTNSGQSLWQILPLNPTTFRDSPYQSPSTFAMNELLICPLRPPIDKFLPGYKPPSHFNERSVDYGPVIEYKHGLYRKAFARYQESKDALFGNLFWAFKNKHKIWLDDYALFEAIKRHFIALRRSGDNADFELYRRKCRDFLTEEEILDYYYGAVWNSWPAELAAREKSAVDAYAQKLADDIEYVKFLQFVVFAQWETLKKYVNEHNIQIIGDLPIFVAYDSADVWAQRDLFMMEGFNPAYVAGVPPDYFSATGQLWGNPLYNWPYHRKTAYAWWIHRLRHVLELVDVVRIDHFRGFEACWRVAYGAADASKGRWIKGPGADLFAAVTERLGEAAIIAEDLGVITEEVTALRRRFGYPGMRILQFGMEDAPASSYLPHNFDDINMVAYTGTHDNNTTLGWYEAAAGHVRDYFRRYMNVGGENVVWDMIRLLFSSSAGWAVVPIQDILGLCAADRMNVPGEKENNWRFRFTDDMITPGAAEGLKYLSELYGRN